MDEYSATNSEKVDFDWDEINVGDYNLDHSENFFAIRSTNKVNALSNALDFNQNTDNLNNSTHECKDFDWVEMQTNANKDYPDDLCDASSNKENLSVSLNWNEISADGVRKFELKEEILIDNKRIQSNQACKLVISDHSDRNTSYESKLERLNLDSSFASLESCNSNVESNFKMPHQSEPKMKVVLTPETDQVKSSPNQEENECCDVNEPAESKPKLKLNWTPMPVRAAEVPLPCGAVKAPRAYECKDMYQAKREMALRQREEEERKAREFHSKPVPNFKALHKRLADTIVIHRITVPVTPETVKHSYAQMERRKRREQENKMNQEQQENAKVGRKILQESKPFQLRADQRVRDRREFDNVVQCNLELKKKQQDEQRKQREQEEIKELRKLTEFKARPNPFK